MLRITALSINILIIIITMGLSGCKTTGLEGLRSLMDSFGYTLYEPPRSNHGPGWTFRITKTHDGKKVPITVCENLYPTVKVTNANINFPQSQVESTVDVDFAVELLDGIIDNIGEAKANLKAKGADSVNITWGNAHAEELLPQQAFTPNGSKIEIDSACAAHLADLKKRGELANNIFMVQQALKVEQMDYQSSASSQTEGGLSVSLKELLTVKPQAKATEVNNNNLSIKEPRYLGFRAFAISDVVPTGLLGPETAVVSGRELTKDEVATLLK